MPTTRYYAPPDAIRGDRLVLPEEEARHAIRVLRQRVGDEVDVVDGAGGWYRVRLEHVDKRSAIGTILERRQEVGEPDYDLTIGLALLKNPNRYETFLEKAVELGVRAVVPLLTARTEKQQLKTARAHNILIAAMKQSGRSRLVDLSPPHPFGAVLEANRHDLALICHEQAPASQSLPAVLRQHSAARSVHLLIGPEGGFAEEEVEAAREAGYLPVSLGPRRLRAETAALAAATAVLLSRL